MSSFALTVTTDGHGRPVISQSDSLPPDATFTVNGHVDGDEEEVEFAIINDVVIRVSGRATRSDAADAPVAA